ncbi:mitochondrial acyl carrier protein [Chamberlinius hualienensis]
MRSWQLLLYCFLFFFGSRIDCQTLELVQVLFRHGDRSPTDPFPNDVNNAYWIETTEGFGMLSNIGKQQHKALGQYLRQRYDGFLNSSYDHRQFSIDSTDVDRTLMSAYCNLAGLYPPSGNQVWNPAIAWQPIPVHTRPTESDYVLSTDSSCPKYDYLFDQVKNSPELVAINLENKYLYEFVTNQTGFYVYDIFSLNHVTDALYCDQCHNLTWPSWVPPLWDQMWHLHDIKFRYEYAVPELSRLKGGNLLGTFISNMKVKSTGIEPTVKVLFFSSHDSTLAAFLGALQLFNDITPPYASAIILELYKDASDVYSVQISYRNDTKVEPYLLTIPNCSNLCPLDQFINLTAPMVPEDIVNECFIIPTAPLFPLHYLSHMYQGILATVGF